MAIKKPSPIPLLTPKEAWQRLAHQPEAVLVDVRCRAEWLFVGVPDTSPLGKKVLFVEWQDMAGMQNPNFMEEIKAVAEGNAQLLMLCRSGQRSQLAAEAAVACGMHAANITSGFEGDLDSHHKRKSINGWCADGLPWRQL
ncbi:MAG: rhodanese-like domain-containing protein [Proteobacteria bacterium]|nr:rhodanese-like domain-containing protein [Pseudomonadota bacterium]